MPYVVASRHTLPASLVRKYGDAEFVDVTSRGPQPWVRFSPYYPHGGIPVPHSPGAYAASVEGLWQGLKVFEHADVDPTVMAEESMHGLKRTERRFGPVRGHRAGLKEGELLDYATARRRIYLPAYRWVLEHRLSDELAELASLGAAGQVVLLDFQTNPDPDDLSRPLSHAALLKHYLEGTWPQ